MNCLGEGRGGRRGKIKKKNLAFLLLNENEVLLAHTSRKVKNMCAVVAHLENVISESLARKKKGGGRKSVTDSCFSPFFFPQGYEKAAERLFLMGDWEQRGKKGGKVWP